MENERNDLFPIFLKLHQLETLIVGGGNVGLEKVSGILRSSPAARITMVADRFHPDVLTLAKNYNNVRLVERKFRNRDLAGKDILILATDDRSLHERIRVVARKRRMIVNVADTPELCDFYLGAVVTKGNIKIGISTNGKSPTVAKRIREFFEEVLPEGTQELLDNMQRIRDRIKGDFKSKVDTLNQITSSWLRH